MGIEITGWHVGVLEQPRATSLSWAATAGPGGPGDTGGSAIQAASFPDTLKGTLTTRRLLTNSGELGG